MRLKRIASLLLLFISLAFGAQCMAQGKGKPLWVNQSEKRLDKKRYSDTYEFKVFNTWDLDVNKLRKERYEPLMEYVSQTFGADVKTMRVDSFYLEPADTLMTYKVIFPQESGEKVIYAKRVDEYCVYEDYEVNDYQYEFYQLYAVSTRLDTIPDFDDFKVSRNYNACSLALSLVPGLGQIQKGQKAKGYTILGAEAALITGSIVCAAKKNYSRRKVRNEIPNVDSWKSKQRSWRQMRDLCLALGGALYVYNLIDAAVAKGNRHLIVDKPQQSEVSVSLSPALYGDGAGVSFSLNF